jgi:hypothetical protein
LINVRQAPSIAPPMIVGIIKKRIVHTKAGNGTDNVLSGSYNSVRIGNKKIAVKISPIMNARSTNNALFTIFLPQSSKFV